MDMRKRAEEAIKRRDAAPYGVDGGRWVIGERCNSDGDVSILDDREDPKLIATKVPIELAAFVVEAGADVLDFAGALLRVTGPEMERRLVRDLAAACQSRACSVDKPCGPCVSQADDVMILIRAVANG